MQSDEYINNVIVTESPYPQDLLDRLVSYVRPLHAAIGLCTEVGELQDAFKKAIFYGRDLDVVNLHEEAGDLTWYLAVLIHWLDSQCESEVSFSTVFNTNIAKLKARYGDKFENNAALIRDLDKEREILDNMGSEEIQVIEAPETIDPMYVKALENRVKELENENKQLQEYKDMYDDLCK